MGIEYYYIKLKSIDYDERDWFLVEDGLSHSPNGVRIFYTIDEAIDVKKFLQEVHKGYTVEIERF